MIDAVKFCFLRPGIFLGLAIISCNLSPSTDPIIPHSNQHSSILFIAFPTKGGARDGSTRLYSMNEEGTNVRALTDTSISVGYAAYSPDGSKIAYTVTDAHNVTYMHSQTWIMNTDTSDRHQVGNVVGQYPVWSPDGVNVVISVASDMEAYGMYELYCFDIGNSVGHQITNLRRAVFASSWTVSGIYCEVVADSLDSTGHIINNTHIIVVDTSGAILGRWGQIGENVHHPVISHDGTQVAFVKNQVTFQGLSMRDLRTGTDSTLIAKNEFLFYRPVSFSPDDSELLYNADNDYSGQCVIRILNLRDGSTKDITPFKGQLAAAAVSWKQP